MTDWHSLVLGMRTLWRREHSVLYMEEWADLGVNVKSQKLSESKCLSHC